jgi:hypothetical protein
LIIYLSNIQYLPIIESPSTKKIGFAGQNINFIPKNKANLPGDVVSYFVTQVRIKVGDGIIDEDWKEVPQYTIEEYTGALEGWIKSIHDDFYIYVLLAYPVEAKWVGVELNASTVPETSMEINHDGWVFGEGVTAPTGELNPITWDGDVHFTGNNGHPTKDMRNDLTYEYILNTEATIRTVEMKRPLNTLDSEGHDFAFTENLVTNVKFASGINQQTHKQGGITHLFTLTTEPFQQSQPETNQTSVSRIAPEEIKANNEFQLMTFTTIEVFLNFGILLAIILFYKKD